ncbi:hypothetical protein AZE42_08283 [Rhizopogon vesiculosus]|uniref:Uncharacterized protein n=1 Tax=Rhizopogon vesiculosus TaxID=180088 RepID=A0A1J8PL11_9AGAM|nr:hypothetical protein AZE42_08283 [Rhizopogon vesiculosus]
MPYRNISGDLKHAAIRLIFSPHIFPCIEAALRDWSCLKAQESSSW